MLSNAQPKPTKAQRQADKRKAQAVAAKARWACCDRVWARDGGRCRRCQTYLQRASIVAALVGHVHEVVYRSAQGDATDPTNCLLLCPACHEDEHRHRIHVVILDPAQGTDGEVEFVEGSGKWRG